MCANGGTLGGPDMPWIWLGTAANRTAAAISLEVGRALGRPARRRGGWVARTDGRIDRAPV